MPNRIIRDDLLESDRWLDLAGPAERLAFIELLLRADDYGLMEAGTPRLFRLWRDSCNLRGPRDAEKVLMALVDADLVRLYEHAGKRYLFIPRFRQRTRSTTPKCPVPPEALYEDDAAAISKFKNIGRAMSDIGQTGDGHAADTRQTDDAQTSDTCPSRVGHPRTETETETETETGYTPTPEDTPRGSAGDGGCGGKGDARASRSPPARGSRLPADWQLPDDWGEWAVAEAGRRGMALTHRWLADEAERFRDYWLAQPGQRGVKLDWLATWRNWVRRSLDQAARARPAATAHVRSPPPAAVNRQTALEERNRAAAREWLERSKADA